MSSSTALSSPSSSSPSSDQCSTSAPPMLEYLPTTAPRYVCADCGAHLALQDELISKSFSGRDGKAYLFSSSINTTLGAKEDRHLLTGMHTVCDLSCKGCSQTLGWFYAKAFEPSQKYKEGKCIMEKGRLNKVNAW